MAVVALLAVGALVAAGCEAQLQAVSEPGATQVIVGSRPDGLTVEAPTWNPATTIVYLCPVAPSKTASDLADAGTIQLDETCQSYGRKDSSHGLTTALPFGRLDATRRAALEASPQWYLVLIGLWPNGPTVFQTAVRPVAIDPAITPGPTDPPSPATSGAPEGSAMPAGSAAP
jgi:hypothetical protein